MTQHNVSEQFDPVAVEDYRQQAHAFLARAREYLAVDDLHQASEKGWGAASHSIKVAAAANGWEYEHHDQFDNVVVNAAHRYRQPSLIRMSDAAHAFHVSFYKRKEFIDAGATGQRIAEIEAMVNALESFIA